MMILFGDHKSLESLPLYRVQGGLGSECVFMPPESEWVRSQSDCGNLNSQQVSSDQSVSSYKLQPGGPLMDTFRP